MANEVKWIKLKVGMFDGDSFKRVKKAKIGGVSYRDKLTAIWLELMDLAGKCNHGGQLIGDDEFPYHTYEDIAIMLDRDENEVELCMEFFIRNRMIEIIDDIYCLSNWCKYQNNEGLDKIRENNRLRQQRFRDNQKLLLENKERNVTHNVTVTSPSYSYSISNDDNKVIDEDSKEKKEKKKKFIPPTLDEVKAYCEMRGNNVDAEAFIAFYESKGWMVGSNKMKSWQSAIITWEKRKGTVSTTNRDRKKDEWERKKKEIQEKSAENGELI